MNQSEQIADIATALAKAQGALSNVTRDKEGQIGQRKYRYATLGNVADTLRDVLAENGLSFTQSCEPKDGIMLCVTTIRHSSGQWFQGSGFVPWDGGSSQDAGVCQTYARRYSLSATLGIVVDDDTDGVGSGGNNQQSQQQGNQGRYVDAKDRPETGKASSPAQVGKLRALQREMMLGREHVQVHIDAIGSKAETYDDLTSREASMLIDRFTKQRDEEAKTPAGTES